MTRIPLEIFDDGHAGELEVRLLPESESLARQLDRMRLAQLIWTNRAVHERLNIIRKARGLIAESAGWLAEVAGGHSGRPMAEAMTSQVLPLADALRFVEREAGSLLKTRSLGAKGRPGWLANVRSVVKREPHGLVLVIAPSNYPLFLPGVAVIQALVAGNGVLLKPGTGGTEAAQALMEILFKAGLNRDLFILLPERPDVVREAIHWGVDKVVFTGSAETGVSLLRQLAPALIPATLELSGCDAVFVRADADLDLVVKALLFGLRLNNGATCIAPRRVFVHRSIATELEGRLAEALSLSEPFTFAIREQEESLVPIQLALAQGAHYVAGDIASDGRIKGPVVLAGVTPAMELLCRDIFAPVLSLVTINDDLEAQELSARCPYALGASIFSADQEASQLLASQVRAGVVTINDIIVPTADPRVPFGGRGRSGYGVTRGAEGLLEMTVPKVIAVRRGRWRPHLEPIRANDAALFESYVQLVHGQNWRGRLGALGRLLRSLVQSRWVEPTRKPSHVAKEEMK